MASNAETRVVYAAGVVQGIALVTFPAASTIFTDPSEYDLSSTQYGTLFLPQVITAIAAALLGTGLAGRVGAKRVYVAGLGAGLLAMALLIASAFVTDDQNVAFVLLLVATGALGAGFGLTVPALNTFAAAFNPGGVDRAILALNALLGLGTVLAPLFVALFDGLRFWWGMPLTSAILLVALLLVSLRLPLRLGARRVASEGRARTGVPSRFWVYAGFAVLYGICEIAAFGVGPLLDAGVDLSDVYASAAIVALVLGAWSFAIARRLSSPASLHPHLGHSS